MRRIFKLIVDIQFYEDFDDYKNARVAIAHYWFVTWRGGKEPSEVS